jgi:hypothetical protein
MTAVSLSPADIQVATAAILNITPSNVTEVINNPTDLQNDLTIAVDILKVASIFFPPASGILEIVSAIETFLPQIEEGVVFLEAVFPLVKDIHITPDLDPEVDAQTHTQGGR